MEVDDNLSMDVSTSYNEPHNDDIHMEDYTELDFALITYALDTNRLIFITNPKNWLGFHRTNVEYVHKYWDYTPGQLRKRFLEHVLPNIDNYELTENEEHLLSLLELNPSFSRTEQGFLPLEPMERLNLTQDEAVIQRIIANYCTDESNGNVIDVDSANNPIVVSTLEQQNGYPKFQLNEENAAFLMVILSSNLDLFNCDLVPVPELRNRLKAAKQHFENCGEQPENIIISIDQLLEKLKKLLEIDGTIMQTIDQRFGV